jgi:hypothetical protein
MNVPMIWSNWRLGWPWLCLGGQARSIRMNVLLRSQGEILTPHTCEGTLARIRQH